MSHKPHDMTPVINLQRLAAAGPVRQRRPQYANGLAPCDAACPAGENIQGWLALAQAGQYRQAWEHLVRDNPLPAVEGRACYHPCESACNRGALDAAVSIHAVERFLGDLADREGWPLPMERREPSGHRVLIVGAGPAGLSAACQLRRLGHEVEIHEAAAEPGGMMRYGIPAYRLPRDVLRREIARIEALGVPIHCNRRVDDLVATRDRGGFAAVFVAIGAQLAHHVDIPARDAPRVLDAVSLLREVGRGERPLLGRRAVIYGGGNTAMDAARTARRLGADETLIVYRRDRAHMPAHGFEADETLEEGIRIRWLSRIAEAIGPELRIELMELDAEGRARPTGRYETLPADSLVLALGQEPDSRFLAGCDGARLQGDGTLVVDRNLMTGQAGLFAGGDAIGGERTVTVAVGHGRRAARAIDAWLKGTTLEDSIRPPVTRFEMLNLPIYSDADPAAQPRLAPVARSEGFDEIVGGLGEPAARYEARRCLSCGNCFECDQCYAACPEQAIVKLGIGLGYRVELSRCTGCAVCAEQCPCHALQMVPEPTP